MDNIINGADVKAVFGLVIENAVTQLGFQMPSRKESLTINQPDANGQRRYLAKPKFNPRSFSFKCVLSAPSFEKLLENFRALFTFITIGGDYQFFNAKLNATAYLYYESQVPETGIYKNDEDGYSVRFTMNFGELDPLANIPTVYLVDDLDRILIP